MLPTYNCKHRLRRVPPMEIMLRTSLEDFALHHLLHVDDRVPSKWAIGACAPGTVARARAAYSLPLIRQAIDPASGQARPRALSPGEKNRLSPLRAKPSDFYHCRPMTGPPPCRERSSFPPFVPRTCGHVLRTNGGIGFDRTLSRIVAVPDQPSMQHRIEVSGPGLAWDIRVNSQSLGGVTGSYTPASAAGSVRRLIERRGVAIA
nr:DUF108 domain-containing protein [uncultured Shinella sp.]